MYTNDEDYILEDESDLKLAYIFIVDRSGSMNDYDRMDMAKKSLELFIQSLPPGSKFKIISFGWKAEELSVCGSTFPDYNDDTRGEAIYHIRRDFRADFGGTKMLTPLEMAFNNTIIDCKGMQKRVFLLTDG